MAAQFIARWEGCKLTAYQDVVGIWTIGYGRTTNVHPGDVTQEQADAWLAEEVETFRRGVRGAVLVPLNGNQLTNGLYVVAYNIGLAAFRGSRCCANSTMETTKALPISFLWNKAGGRVVQGLVNRRAAERDLFLKG